jgi:hypothetical protein
MVYEKPVGHDILHHGVPEWDARGTHPRHLFSKSELSSLDTIDRDYRKRIRAEYPLQPETRYHEYDVGVGNVLIDARGGRLVYPYHDQIQEALRESRSGIQAGLGGRRGRKLPVI